MQDVTVVIEVVQVVSTIAEGPELFVIVTGHVVRVV